MPYAAKTTVTATKTRLEIESFLKKKGADVFGTSIGLTEAAVMFDMKGLRLRFKIRWKEKASEQQIRSLWRALLLCIKAKVASVESGIVTFEEAFMAHIVIPGSSLTFYDHFKPEIKLIGQGETPNSMLFLEKH